MIYKVINTVSLAIAAASASTSALVVPSGVIRVASTTNAFFSITSSAGTATNADIAIGAGQEMIIEVANGSFINALRESANGRMSISCVEIGQQVAQ